MSSLWYALLFSMVLVWFFYIRHIHIGYGMALVRKEKDGSVWVASRLIGSPAWKCGIKNNSQVYSVNGVLLHFGTEEEFLFWREKNKPILGKKERWIFDDGIVANLAPAYIFSSIPVYWSPNNKDNTNQEDPVFRSRLSYCTKTGSHFCKDILLKGSQEIVFFH